MNAILIADSVAKSFGDRRVLTSATLRAVPGEVRVLFGRNGEGKSTLLKIAAGWIQPDSGTVRFAGEAHLNAALWRLARRGLFYLPDHDLLRRDTTVRRQLEMLRLQFNGGDVVEAMDRMGVAGRVDQRPTQLSGGEKRRAEIAAVLVRRPTCLLADEPYRGVAPKDAEDLSATFRALAAQGTAVVLTGHEAPTLLDVADHVTWSTSGTTYELGPPGIARKHEAFTREYLGPSSSRGAQRRGI